MIQSPFLTPLATLPALVLPAPAVRTRAELAAALFTRNPRVSVSGRVGLLQSVTREDGSGHCFIVRLLLADGTHAEVFVRLPS